MPRVRGWRATLIVVACAVGPAGPGGCGCGDEVGAGADESSGGEGSGDGRADQDDDTGGSDGDESPPQVSLCRQPTLEVYEGLRRSCVGCHDEGTNAPFAADFAAFEQLVAYNTDLVIPGNPSDSILVLMLQGSAPPPLDQMPPGAVSFAELSDAGSTDISLAEVEDWIETLEHCDVPGANLSPRYARRVDAEQIHAMLAAQLDLLPAEVEHVTRFPIDDPVFGSMTDANNSALDAWARWAALGGPDYLKGIRRDTSFSPLFFQTVGPLAQAWCDRSLELGRDALFPGAGETATDEASVRANIEALYLDLLGVVATTDDIDAMYFDVYLHYANTDSHRVAMKAVCSAFIRHPLWLTY